MDKEQAKAYIQSHSKEHFKRDGSGKGFICPICGSGSGNKGTGITTKDGVHFTCWTGCFTSADVIDIIGMEQGLTAYPDKLKAAAAEYGITLDGTYNHKAETAKSNTQYTTHNTQNTIQNMEEAERDYTAFFEEAHSHIGDTGYRRGLSAETLNRFNIGYVEKWKHPKAGASVEPSPRLIIPTSKHSYLARDTRGNLTPEQKQYSKSKVGSVRIFNADALWTATSPVFVVEGEIDAMSIVDVGGEALGLGSTANYKKLLSILDGKKPAQPLIIALDRDDAGKKTTDELIAGLDRLAVTYYVADITGSYKDANEALNADREAFTAAVKAAQNPEEAEREKYLQTSTANYLQAFVDGISASVNTPFLPTGFPKLDTDLDGGLYEGLYFFGAISSLGKTTFCLQIADQIAQAGQDVLIFSLEMARTELMAKSISRHTLQAVLQNGGEVRNAKTARGITTGKRYQNYNGAELGLISNAITTYGEYAKHIFIREGVGNIGVDQIRNTIQNHIRYTGNAPVVIVDYVQILAPVNERYTDKQNMDKSVMELKRITRDFKIPLIGISSFNRASYAETVTMEAFKESGGIEYSSDVLIGLQLKGAGEKGFDVNKAKQDNPRKVELVILKNRNGKTGCKIDYSYYPMFNYFAET